MTIKRQFVDFVTLQRIGWPYSKVHTLRKSEAQIQRSEGSRRKGTFRQWLEPNPDPFPAPTKLGWHPNSPLLWPFDKVKEYFEKHGLVLQDMDDTP
jgi:hypothetical protein